MGEGILPKGSRAPWDRPFFGTGGWDAPRRHPLQPAWYGVMRGGAGNSTPEDEERSRSRGGLVPSGFFAEAYQGRPPWDIGRPQPVIERLAERNEIVGPVLDA